MFAAIGCAAPTEEEEVEGGDSAIVGGPGRAKLETITQAYESANAADFVERPRPTRGTIAQEIASWEANDCRAWTWRQTGNHLSVGIWEGKPKSCYEWKLYEWRGGDVGTFLVVDLIRTVSGRPANLHLDRSTIFPDRSEHLVWIFSSEPEPKFVVSARVSPDGRTMVWQLNRL
jgi:hypothetical protein